MVTVLQRVSEGRVTVKGRVTGSIHGGLVILIGVVKGDTEADADYLVDKTVGLRIFGDETGKMNLSLRDVNGGALVVSQFTLCSDYRKGRRPSFDNAASPTEACRLYDYFCARLSAQGIRVETGEFGAAMAVSLVNDGPVTFVLDSAGR